MKERVNQFDGLRILMVFVIVISHYSFVDNFLFADFYYKRLNNPVFAVDFFFMLSGYGIMHNYIQNPCCIPVCNGG